MQNPFRHSISDMLPNAQAVQARLSALSNRDRLTVADYLSVHLPDVDVLIATPGAVGLAQNLGILRGIPTVTATSLAGHWTLVGPALHQPRDIQPMWGPVSAAVITVELLSGQAELAAAVLGAQKGWKVAAVAAAVARTDAAGHVRLALQELPVITPVQLADTPRGLIFERRTPPLPLAKTG